jgi:hypothetical protein
VIVGGNVGGVSTVIYCGRLGVDGFSDGWGKGGGVVV